MTGPVRATPALPPGEEDGSGKKGERTLPLGGCLRKGLALPLWREFERGGLPPSHGTSGRSNRSEVLHARIIRTASERRNGKTAATAAKLGDEDERLR